MGEKGLYIGSKIKKIRRNKNINQKSLALQLGISASYLNLIERNRRGLTVNLLLKLTEVLEVNITDLNQEADSQVANDLLEILSTDLFAEFEITNQDIKDLASENPQIGKAIIRLFDKYNNERKLYQNILSQNNQHSQIEFEGSAGLLSEIVSDYIQSNNNYFPSLENAAQRVRLDIDLTGETLFQGLKTFGMNSFALRVVTMELPDDESFKYQPDIGLLTLSSLSDASSRLFYLAEHIGIFAAKHDIDDIIEDADFEDERINEYLAHILARYFAACIMMPYDLFLNKAKETRYDIELLCHYFEVSFEQACHRLN